MQIRPTFTLTRTSGPIIVECRQTAEKDENFFSFLFFFFMHKRDENVAKTKMVMWVINIKQFRADVRCTYVLVIFFLVEK